ncbi:hypothetical protein LTR85_003681 [Meristemomyces frigidus]|nr:hypothetical protein LTR85_003681 [Meristemomyces frigidus]
MADAQNDRPRRPAEVVKLCSEACEKDEPALLNEAISIASTPGSRFSKSDMIQKGLQGCIAWRALRVLTYLLEQQDASADTVYPSTIYSLEKPGARRLLPFLEVLLAHGWDIDTHGPQRTSWPLLWFATSDTELLDWCLQHGASVYIPGDTPSRDRNGAGAIPRTSLLEKAAGDATVATFEKLRAKGARLGQRTLHLAVYRAAHHARKDGSEDKSSYEERMAMVRHLIDVVGLDVNADGGYVGEPSGTPLCALAHLNNGRDTRELIWCLLDRGADPDQKGGVLRAGSEPQPSALEIAQPNGNTLFLDAVTEWRARQKNRST